MNWGCNWINWKCGLIERIERRKKDHQWLSNPILMLKFSLSYPHVMKQTKCFCLLNHYIILPRFSVNGTDWRLLIFFSFADWWWSCWCWQITWKTPYFSVLLWWICSFSYTVYYSSNRLSFSPALRCTTFRLRQLWDSNFAGLYQIEGRRFHLLTPSLSLISYLLSLIYNYHLLSPSLEWHSFFIAIFSTK